MKVETKVATSTAMFAAAAAAAASANSAMAADLYTKAPPAMSPAPITAWQGFFVGGSLGGAWLNSTQDDTNNAILSGGYYDASPGSSQSGSAFGLIGGVSAGINFQDGNFVYGLQGDFSWLGNNSASTTSVMPKNVSYYAYGSLKGSKSSKVSELATLRARFGWDFDGTLPYVTIGAALGHIKNTYTAYDQYGVWSGASGSKTSWEPGLVVGAGIEHQFANSHWSMKGEVLWVGFKNTSMDSPINQFAYDGYSPGSIDFKNELVIGTIGLNYRF